MIQFQEETFISAKPETIFAIYEDVQGWCQWDPDVQYSSIDGAFAAGTVGRLKPRNGPLVKMRLIHVEKNRSFINETALPLCKMKFGHQLIPDGKTTRVLHIISFSGPLAFFFGNVIGKKIKQGLPEALRGLKSKAEKQSGT
ncbi:SRPBCC family protein [Ignavibacterium album]|uniref:SRPBCC family protein n=1 Tax=Ignavibacterium album TaxID=591197 RepID=UPI0026EADB46|nr:SRPBCC family protein [Ignavibacterium album]